MSDLARNLFSRFPTASVLDWYDSHARRLPWRYAHPHLAPAYHVFLSELMLQQTIVATVIPYFNDFIEAWPDIHALALAREEDVLARWAGLGYYARARNLHKTAKIIAFQHGGIFPQSVEALMRLPGIGPYTAGAIAALAFGQPSIILDGNIERIFIRFAGIKQPAAQVKPLLRAAYAQCRDRVRVSDFPQALMDLGALICQPKTVSCASCPLAENCVARLDNPTALPIKPAKKPRPIRTGSIMLITNAQNEAIVERRARQGLLGGLLSFPSWGWDKSPRPAWAQHYQHHLNWQKSAPKITHVFTHFTAEITVICAQAGSDLILADGHFWAKPQPDHLPSLMAKCWRAAHH